MTLPSDTRIADVSASTPAEAEWVTCEISTRLQEPVRALVRCSARSWGGDGMTLPSDTRIADVSAGKPAEAGWVTCGTSTRLQEPVRALARCSAHS